MTLRGIKDRDAAALETFASTCGRMSQRLVTSGSVCKGWQLTAIDVRKAFLKESGTEFSKATKEPQRKVCFELDCDAAEMRQALPGFKDFNPDYELLEMLKPGAGCKYAPRCWAIQLSKATNDEFGCKPTTHDEQLITRHKHGQLDCIGSKHVDDITLGSDISVLMEFIACLEKLSARVNQRSPRSTS